jgi:hypothetical protein
MVASNIERKHPTVLTPIAKGRHSDITIVLHNKHYTFCRLHTGTSPSLFGHPDGDLQQQPMFIGTQIM